MGATFLYVAHDQIEPMTHVAALDQGRLAPFGTPREIYESQVCVHVATRLRQPRINLWPADLFCPDPYGPAPAGAVRMGLRPEHIVEG